MWWVQLTAVRGASVKRASPKGVKPCLPRRRSRARLPVGVNDHTDIAIIGAGAAGLAAAIFAGEEAADSRARIVLLDGARKPGAKILVSGGGRCNVTNATVTPDDYCGGPRTIIRNVLRAFDERRTVDWMRSLGVELKEEPTGKLFPVTDSARTVLDALLRRLREVGVECRWGWRVNGVYPMEEGFELTATKAGDSTRPQRDDETEPQRDDDTERRLTCRRLIVATGGLSLPKSGSDGAGLEWMRTLGHTIIPTTPALAPLVLRAGEFPGGQFADLAGITLEVRLTLVSEAGKTIASRTGSVVFTHFGISGPAAMDLSRDIARWRMEHPGVVCRVLLGHPSLASAEAADHWLLERVRANPARMTASAAGELYPERLARLLGGEFGRLGELTRDARREAASRLAALPLEVRGDRGYSFAETTAGGVDLREVDPRTMESRVVPRMHLCGEMLDVDGRIGGFCFQWAWATGYLAGREAARGMAAATGKAAHGK